MLIFKNLNLYYDFNFGNIPSPSSQQNYKLGGGNEIYSLGGGGGAGVITPLPRPLEVLASSPNNKIMFLNSI